jgi:hypothetical protein
MPGDTSRKNGKKGGRPVGAKSAATIERDAELRAYRDRVAKNTQRLLDAEMTVAQGVTMLFKKPKAGAKGETRKVERVTDEATIRQYLDGELESDQNDFYFLATERPDTVTIQRMLDRTYDKPPQAVALGGTDGGAIEVVKRVVFEVVNT